MALAAVRPAKVLLFVYSIIVCCSPHRSCVCMGESRDGDTGVLIPLKNHINIGFLSNTGSDPQKKKLPSQHSILSHHRHTSETPFKWRSADGPMMARL